MKFMKALSIRAVVSWLTKKAVWKQHRVGHAANAVKKDTGPNLRALCLYIVPTLRLPQCIFPTSSEEHALKSVEHISAA